MRTNEQPFSREFWRPDERRVWVRKQPRWGRGWTVNWAEIARRVRPRRRSRSKPCG